MSSDAPDRADDGPARSPRATTEPAPNPRGHEFHSFTTPRLAVSFSNDRKSLALPQVTSAYPARSVAELATSAGKRETLLSHSSRTAKETPMEEGPPPYVTSRRGARIGALYSGRMSRRTG